MPARGARPVPPTRGIRFQVLRGRRGRPTNPRPAVRTANAAEKEGVYKKNPDLELPEWDYVRPVDPDENLDGKRN